MRSIAVAPSGALPGEHIRECDIFERSQIACVILTIRKHQGASQGGAGIGKNHGS